MDGVETVIDVLPFLTPLILLEFAHGASTAAFFVCITLALLLIGVAAIIASQITWGLLSITVGVLVAAPPASSRAIERWCYRAGAFLPAVVIVDDSLWDYLVGESYPLEHGK